MIVHPVWPPSEWGSAIAALAFAYLLGHFLQGFATNALPSTLVKGRFPSAALLDPGTPPEFPDELRHEIAEIVKTRLHLDVRVDAVGNDEIDRARNSVFNIARLALSKDKVVSYPEQFEGMYALSRGLAVGLGLGSSYLFGWTASRCAILVKPAYILASIAFLWLIILSSQLVWGSRESHVRTTREWRSLGAVGVVLLCAGYFLGRPYAPCHDKWFLFAIIAVATLIASFRFYNAYKFFAVHFAKTVWRDFLAFRAFRSEGNSTATPNAKGSDH